MTSCPPQWRGLCWPSYQQRLLLEALLLPPDEARKAFAMWASRCDLDRLDGGSLDLLPALGHRLVELGIRHALQERLRGAARYHWCRNQRALREAHQAIVAMREATISPVALKGLALWPNYPKPGSRPMNDVDLLVPSTQFTAARTLLNAAGWRLRRKGVASHAIALVRASTHLDLHQYALAEDCRSAPDAAFFTDTREYQTGGCRIAVPSPTVLLFHVLVHGARYSVNQSAHWVRDAFTLLDQESIDWSFFTELTDARRLWAPVFDTLRFLRELGANHLPANLLPSLEEPTTALHWAEYAMYVKVRPNGSCLVRPS